MSKKKMSDFSLIPPDMLELIRIIAIAGFVATATLVVSLNFKAFNQVFQSQTNKLWWLFLLLMIFPLMLILYIFSLIFGDYNIVQAIARRFLSQS